MEVVREYLLLLDSLIRNFAQELRPHLGNSPELLVVLFGFVALLLFFLIARGERKSSELEEASALAPARSAATSETPVLETQENVTATLVVEAPQPSLAKPAAQPLEESTTVVKGLSKTRVQFATRLKEIFTRKQVLGADVYDALEELLITSDLGVSTTRELLDDIQNRSGDLSSLDENAVRSVLRDDLTKILHADSPPAISIPKESSEPLVVMIVGVNGVGKTTSIAKLAQKFSNDGARVLLAACDTFRAAAVDQLEVWADRIGVDLVRGAENAKPSTVAYQAIHKAKGEGYDVLIVDTAGRLHTRVNLMNELANVAALIDREQPGAPHETILVVDASTGQNALQQAKEFHDKASLSGVIVTKLDGTPKGGIVVAIRKELGIPIRYIGVGEAVGDLKVFSAPEFVDGILELGEGGISNVSELNEIVSPEREEKPNESTDKTAKVKRGHRRNLSALA